MLNVVICTNHPPDIHELLQDTESILFPGQAAELPCQDLRLLHRCRMWLLMLAVDLLAPVSGNMIGFFVNFVTWVDKG